VTHLAPVIASVPPGGLGISSRFIIWAGFYVEITTRYASLQYAAKIPPEGTIIFDKAADEQRASVDYVQVLHDNFDNY